MYLREICFQIQITCFQSFGDGSNPSRREIEMEVINNNNSLLLNNLEVRVYIIPSSQSLKPKGL